MRKLLLLTLILLLGFLFACGGSSRPQSVTSTFAFIQEAPNYSYAFTPMLGQFVVTGSKVAFEATAAAMDAGTGNPVKGEFYSIVLSPDGKKATFDLLGGTLDSPTDQWDIWVANADTSNIMQITNDSYDDALPQFSPDGTKVVFASYRPVPETEAAYQWQIVIRNVTGSGEQVLPIPDGVIYQFHPSYSPDGGKIVMTASGYTSQEVPFAGIYVVNADGSNPTLLTNPLYSSESCYYCQDEDPVFTADGTKIVFSRYNDTNNAVEDVYIMNADGTGVTQLTDGTAVNADPSLITIQGVGDRILFNSNRSNPSNWGSATFDLYSMKFDGTGVTRLTNNALYDGLSGEWYDVYGTANAASNRVLGRNQPAPYRGHLPVTRPNLK